MLFGELAIFVGRGDGTFAQQAGPTPSTFGYTPQSVVAADLNGDGVVDLVIVDYPNGVAGVTSQLSVFLGTGAGTFTPPRRPG